MQYNNENVNFRRIPRNITKSQKQRYALSFKGNKIAKTRTCIVKFSLNFSRGTERAKISIFLNVR